MGHRARMSREYKEHGISSHGVNRSDIQGLREGEGGVHGAYGLRMSLQELTGSEVGCLTINSKTRPRPTCLCRACLTEVDVADLPEQFDSYDVTESCILLVTLLAQSRGALTA